MHNFNVSNNQTYVDAGLVINKDRILTVNDIADYEKFIIGRIDNIVNEEGRILGGNLDAALYQARRGWLLRGLHYLIAEKSCDHSKNLRKAGQYYSYNPDNDINPEIIGLFLDVHDLIDAILFDIIPGDNISKEDKEKMELFGMKKLYDKINNGTGDMLLSNYRRYATKRTRESVVGWHLDKMCPVVKAREYMNNKDKIFDFYKQNDKAEAWLRNKIYPEANTLADAVDMIINRLGEFYAVSKERIKEPFFRYVLDEVHKIESREVYTHYFNMLSSVPISSIK